MLFSAIFYGHTKWWSTFMEMPLSLSLLESSWIQDINLLLHRWTQKFEYLVIFGLLRFLDILKIWKSSQTFKCYVTILLTTGWMRLKAIFCAVASFSSHIHANLCKHAFFFDGCYFSSSRPRQSFPMFSFQNQHILVYKHQFGCYSSGAAFFLSCEQIPSKCIRRVKLTPH